MYSANLSFKLLEKYLSTVLRLEFIQNKGFGYELTPLGRDFLKRYKSFDERLARALDNLRDLSYERTSLEDLCLKFSDGQNGQLAGVPNGQDGMSGSFGGYRFRDSLNLDR